ncbi:prepilin peptidase [Veillonella criceti]|uniref:Type IV leader peptidase family n=1 Tax=Veillonella criceti TaxID=103891 RepID=A0A380NKS4_9FIRM|nr:prepilin peptidase [Veillonella criceti]SUP41887.1 Type IV leader peptidase family [Veillonella criceti]
MWLQYSLGSIGGLLAGLGSFYLLDELVIERERRFDKFYMLCVGMGLLVGLSGAYLMKSLSMLFLTIIFGSTLFIGATIDKQYLILPDEGAILLLISGLSRIWLLNISWQFVLMGVSLVWLGGSFLQKVTNGGLGLGDIKWCSVFACWLSLEALWYTIVLAFVGGTCWLLLYWLVTKRTLHILPFGPFLCIAAWIMYLWEQGGGLISI